MRAFSDYLMCEQMGVMPYSGGWREQPNSVRVYFEIFRAAHAEAQEVEAKKAKG